METNSNKGEFRCLTPEEIGNAVAKFRKANGIKQITLAYEAGKIQERTVQRLENGEKVSEDTLRKVAKALRLDENAFLGPRYIPTDEEALENAARFLSEILIIEAKELTDLHDCAALFGVHGYVIIDKNVAPADFAEVAAFKDQLQDWGDIYGDLSHTERLEGCQSVLTNAQKIGASGYRILYGIYETEDKYRVTAIVFLPKGDDSFSHLKQLMVPRQFMSMIS